MLRFYSDEGARDLLMGSGHGELTILYVGNTIFSTLRPVLRSICAGNPVTQSLSKSGLNKVHDPPSSDQLRY